MPDRTNLLTLIMCSALLAACGGGGGGGNGVGSEKPTPVAPSDNPPQITSSNNISMAENSTVAHTVTATDKDNDVLTYSLVSGAGGKDNLLFNLNKTTGVLSFKTPPDFEVPTDDNIDNSYQVRISSSDGSTTASQAVTVKVSNLNDNTPSFTGSFKVTIKEKIATAQTFTAIDSDNDKLIYSIESGSGGDDNPLFNIDNTSGTLSFKTPPAFGTPNDSDGDNAYQVLVGVSDGTNKITQAATINVSLIGFPFIENFSSGSNRWTIVDDYSESSQWVVNSEAFVQRVDNGISSVTRELDETFHRGTYAYLSAGLSLTDYRVSADLTPLKQPGYSIYDDGHDIGLMFRYQDNDNYYRIVLNSEYGYARLDRKVAGVFNTLAVDARGYSDEGVLIRVVVEVRGDLIQVYIDGEPRFAVRDSGLSRGSVAVYTEDGARFDNIIVDSNSTVPSIVINEPTAFTAQAGSIFNVSAVALNVPASGKVDFALNGNLCGATTQVSPGYFTARCTASTQNEHTIKATLRDGSAIASDTNTMVASSAEVRVVVGDSISNGVTDSFRKDNQSADGKVVGEQGYAAVLQDLLSASRSAPQMIYNEAVPGDESWELEQRLASILGRHPNAKIAQIMIGTNDAGQSLPIPSGLGCSGIACNGTYKENIQNIINTLQSAGVTPIIALIPPSFSSSTPLTSERNLLNQQYNSVLRNELSVPARGPDTFSYFLSANENRVSMFADTLHVNGLGYVILARLWEHYLNGGTSLPNRSQLPLVLEDICVRLSSTACQSPLQYKQDLMVAGNPYYTDTNFSIQSIPSILNGGLWVKTANTDKTITRSDYLGFTIDRNVDVYIAYDAKASSLPAWLGGYSYTGQTLAVSNPSAPAMKLYKKSYQLGVDTPANGTINLGGNLAGGGVGATANYVVIIKAQ